MSLAWRLKAVFRDLDKKKQYDKMSQKIYNAICWYFLPIFLGAFILMALSF